jgi:hypothetical protein
MQYICETYVQTFNFSPIQEETSLSNGEWLTMYGYKLSTENHNNSVLFDIDQSFVLYT